MTKAAIGEGEVVLVRATLGNIIPLEDVPVVFSFRSNKAFESGGISEPIVTCACAENVIANIHTTKNTRERKLFVLNVLC